MNSSANGLSLYRRILTRGKWVIIGGTVFCAAIAGVVSWLLPPVYEASIILEVGRIYPIPEAGIKKEAILIEEPMAMAEILRGTEFLERTREELGLTLPLEKMINHLAVEQIVALTRFQRSESTLVKATWEDNSPETCVAVLNSLAELLIDQHDRIYRVAVRNLADRIVVLKSRIAAAGEVIAGQEAYQETLTGRIAAVEAAADDYEKTVEKLEYAETNPNELLFFKSTLNSLQEQLIKLETELNASRLVIGEEEEKIQDARDMIANLDGYRELSRNTEIRSRPVLPEKPIKPDKSLNLTLGAILGLLITIAYVFLAHYARPGE